MNEYVKRTLLVVEGNRPIAMKEMCLKVGDRDDKWAKLVTKVFDDCVKSSIKRAMSISYEFSDAPFEIKEEDKKWGDEALKAIEEGFTGLKKTEELINRLTNSKDPFMED